MSLDPAACGQVSFDYLTNKMAEKRNIFLVGPMGAGKSTIGKHLADQLHMEFFDSDQEIEHRTGADISWVFDVEGEDGFRKREEQVIGELTELQGIVQDVAPAVFIDVAEQRGLIEEIGGEVLQQAIQDAAQWLPLSPGTPPFVSVNVSPWQLRNSTLTELVAGALKTSTLPPEFLHLELTETAVIGDEPRARGVLASLRDLGVRVWLDDFGTGFSGLSHLRRVPVDGVKIDRSFVADVLRDPDDLALTTAIIAMAHSLGIHVVAEGVEKEGQYAILRERGCDLAQGFWLGHPMGNQEFMRLLA